METNSLFTKDQDKRAAVEDIALELNEIARQNAIDEVMAEELIADFADTIRKTVEWKRKAMAITVTDASQVFEMAAAKALGKELQQARLAVEKNRKEKKEQYLRKGKAVDGMANVIFGFIEPLEKHLKLQVNFVKLQEEKAEADRRAAADKLLAEQEEADRLAEEQRIKDQAAENARLKQEAEEWEAARKVKEQEATEREERRQAEIMEAARKLKEQEDAAAEQKRQADEAQRKEREEQQKITDQKASKARADAERSRKAAVQRERESQEKIRETARLAAEDKAEREKAVYAEELRKARQVVCPECGHEFDSAEHKASQNEGDQNGHQS